MAGRSSAELGRALQKQRAQIDNQARIRALEAQLQAAQIQLGAAESKKDRAVVDAVAQANANSERKYQRLVRRCVNETATLTQRIQMITAQKTALETRVEELEAQVEELENAAPAPADAVMDDGMMTCPVCVEDFPKNTMQNCNGRTNRTEANPDGEPAEHYVCSECFIGGVKTAMSDFLVDVKCLGGCQTPYTHEPIRKLLPDAEFRRWLWLQTQKEAAQIQATRDAYWLERIATGFDPEEAEVERIASIICNDILTNKCGNPNCRLSFLDFDGCFAIKCESGCQCYFCGWCMDFYDQDYHIAHHHVRTCPKSYNPGSYFATMLAGADFMGGGDVESNMLWFKKARINTQRQRYNEVMQNIPPNLQERIVAKCTQERLEEAGLIGEEGENFAREAREQLERIQNPLIHL